MLDFSLLHFTVEQDTKQVFTQTFDFKLFQWQCESIHWKHEQPNVCFIQIIQCHEATYVLN